MCKSGDAFEMYNRKTAEVAFHRVINLLIIFSVTARYGTSGKHSMWCCILDKMLPYDTIQKFCHVAMGTNRLAMLVLAENAAACSHHRWVSGNIGALHYIRYVPIEFSVLQWPP